MKGPAPPFLQDMSCLLDGWGGVSWGHIWSLKFKVGLEIPELRGLCLNFPECSH